MNLEDITFGFLMTVPSMLKTTLALLVPNRTLIIQVNQAIKLLNLLFLGESYQNNKYWLRTQYFPWNSLFPWSEYHWNEMFLVHFCNGHLQSIWKTINSFSLAIFTSQNTWLEGLEHDFKAFDKFCKACPYI